MLPILPAILILLLNGPAALDRMAEGSRLPAALMALHGRLDSAREEQMLRALHEPGCELVLASLLKLSQSSEFEFEEAITRLLFLAGLEQPAAPHRPPPQIDPDPDDCHAPWRPQQIAFDEGPTPTGDRTRDGPAAL